jgi:hypothetical protein
VPSLVDPERLLQCDVLDWRPRSGAPAGPVIPRQPQTFDYQARDYDSFLRAMLDLIPARAPGWRQRMEGDLGMALLELFAYVGDQLSYYQDRMHNEGYLRTATQYESVRRLLSLIDYRLDPGAAARARLAATTTATRPVFPGFAISTAASGQRDPVVFEVTEPRILYPELNNVALSVDAPSNAARTQAMLNGELDGFLPAESWMLFQSPATSEWAQIAGPVSVDHVLHRTTVTLRKPLAGTYAAPAAHVNGNGLVATHGESHVEEARGTGAAAQTLALVFAPVTFIDDVDGVPQSSLRVEVDGTAWQRVDDFIDSSSTDAHYRTIQDNDGFVTVQFGDRQQGRVPAAGAAIAAHYRAGIGEAGLVAARSLTQFNDPDGRITSLMNPHASFGARRPQGVEEAKLVGPRLARRQNRAVTPQDYEDILLGGVRLDGDLIPILHAKARFEWTGSWTTVAISVDFADRLPLASVPARRSAIETALAQKKLAGFDLQVEDARYAPVHIALVVHIKPEFFARQVREELDKLLGPAGFFAPGRFTFGQTLRLSDLYAAAHAVEGVRYLSAPRFKRLGDRYPNRVQAATIEVGALEIVRCDHDPAHPENGVLHVRTRGGKEG